MAKNRNLPVPVNAIGLLPTMLAEKSNHLPTMTKVKRLHGPLAFRELLGVSALTMRVLLAQAGYEVRQHQTIYTWERQERTPYDLPKHYWTRRYMPDKARQAYHRLIILFVEVTSNGRYGARVTGKRLWRVALRKL